MAAASSPRVELEPIHPHPTIHGSMHMHARPRRNLPRTNATPRHATPRFHNAAILYSPPRTYRPACQLGPASLLLSLTIMRASVSDGCDAPNLSHTHTGEEEGGELWLSVLARAHLWMPARPCERPRCPLAVARAAAPHRSGAGPGLVGDFLPPPGMAVGLALVRCRLPAGAGPCLGPLFSV